MATRYRVTVGDEEIEFEGPDDLSDSDIENLASNELVKAKPGQTFGRPVYAGSVTEPTPQTYAEKVGANFDSLKESLTGFAQGVAQPLDAAANLLESGYNNTLGNLFGQSDSADTPAFQNLAAGLGEGDPGAQTAGRFAGTAFLTKGMGGPVAQGVGAGVLEGDGQGFWETARDAVVGGAGGKVGDLVGKGLGHVISPIVDDAARLLHSKGVRLTPGQAMPGLKRSEDKLMSYPFIGDKIAEGRRQSFEGFSRAQVEEVLAPIGMRLPKGIKTGNQAVKFAGDRLSERFERLIPNLAVRGDQQFASDIQALGSTLRSGEISPANVRKFETMVRDGVMSRLKGAEANGTNYNAADKYVGKMAERFGKSTNPEDQALAEAFRELRDAMAGMLDRSNPAAAAELQALREGWSRLVPVESAAAGAKRGIASAEQFRAAVRQNNKTVRKRGVARGEAAMQNLAEAGSEILPSQYPDSGTSGREAFSVTDPRFWIGMGASPFYGERVQNALSGIALSPRPAFAQPIAEGVKALPSAQLGSLGAANAYLALSPADR